MSWRIDGSGSYSITYNVPYWLKKIAIRYSRGMNISPKARGRLAMMECYYTLRDVTATCRMFQISRKNFYKWLHRYEQSDRQATSLEDVSKAPITRRKTTLTLDKELRIKHLREKYKCYGKKKLQKVYRRKYRESVSTHHIQYVIEKYNLYPDPVKAAKIRCKKKHWGGKKVRVHNINPKNYLKEGRPFFVSMDTIVLYLPYGVKRYIFTAIECTTKIAYARVYTTRSSKNASDFLQKVYALLDGQISLILSDNGSEFLGDFDALCEKLKITHVFTRNNTPKDNAVDERFNRTVQEEFMQLDEYFEPSLVNTNLTETNDILTSWLEHYNFERPHQSLDYLSPIEYYHYKFIVSPIYPAITLT